MSPESSKPSWRPAVFVAAVYGLLVLLGYLKAAQSHGGEGGFLDRMPLLLLCLPGVCLGRFLPGIQFVVLVIFEPERHSSWWVIAVVLYNALLGGGFAYVVTALVHRSKRPQPQKT